LCASCSQDGTEPSWSRGPVVSQQAREDPEHKWKARVYEIVGGQLHEYGEDDQDKQRLGYSSSFYVRIVAEITRSKSQGEHQPGVKEEERQPASQQKRYVCGLGVGEG
jgi:hypothetical protein